MVAEVEVDAGVGGDRSEGAGGEPTPCRSGRGARSRLVVARVVPAHREDHEPGRRREGDAAGESTAGGEPQRPEEGKGQEEQHPAPVEGGEAGNEPRAEPERQRAAAPGQQEQAKQEEAEEDVEAGRQELGVEVDEGAQEGTGHGGAAGHAQVPEELARDPVHEQAAGSAQERLHEQRRQRARPGRAVEETEEPRVEGGPLEGKARRPRAVQPVDGPDVVEAGVDRQVEGRGEGALPERERVETADGECKAEQGRQGREPLQRSRGQAVRLRSPAARCAPCGLAARRCLPLPFAAAGQGGLPGGEYRRAPAQRAGGGLKSIASPKGAQRASAGRKPERPASEVDREGYACIGRSASHPERARSSRRPTPVSTVTMRSGQPR